MPLFTDLEGQRVYIYMLQFVLKIVYISFALLIFVQILHYIGFTIQLALLHVFNVKVKNLALDT